MFTRNIIIVVFALYRISFSQNHNSYNSIPDADSTYLAEWNFINDNYLGIIADTPLRDEVGEFPVGKFALNFDNWFPVTSFKEILSGKLIYSYLHMPHYIELFANEKDWNLVIKPEGNSRKLMQLAKVYANNSNIKNFNKDYREWYIYGNDTCIEAEITPNIEFIKANSYFRITKKDEVKEGEELTSQPLASRLLNKNICVYGPFVAESLHNYRPEIHPAELIWFKTDSSNNTENHSILVINDGSRRFSGSEDFSDYEEMDKIEPWGKPPVFPIIKYCFRVTPNAEKIIFEIGVNSTPDKTVDNQYSVFSETTEISKELPDNWGIYLTGFLKDGNKKLIYKDKVIAEIIETNYNEKFGVSIEDIRLDKDGSIMGYFVIKVIVGESEEYCGYVDILLNKKILK